MNCLSGWGAVTAVDMMTIPLSGWLLLPSPSLQSVATTPSPPPSTINPALLMTRTMHIPPRGVALVLTRPTGISVSVRFRLGSSPGDSLTHPRELC